MRPDVRKVRAMSVQRHCQWGDHWVPTRDATEVAPDESGSGPGAIRYACWPHVYEHNLQTTSRPSAGPLIGRRDAAPIIPGRGAR